MADPTLNTQPNPPADFEEPTIKPLAMSTRTDACPTSTGFHTACRAINVDEGAHWRPQPSDFAHPRLSLRNSRRRGSTLSDYTLSEAKRNFSDGILNPSGTESTESESKWAWLPLGLALLPPFAGILHQNGSAFITDVILLILAAVFLNWSVTQPWAWYYSAQEIRAREETVVEMAVDSDSDEVCDDEGKLATESQAARNLNDITTGQNAPICDKLGTSEKEIARQALGELYFHEVAALAMCFASPLIAAVLLHGVRSQLSRPSEGLVSNYNLTIFILAAEVAPLSQLIKLIQARTLHLQRIVHANPCQEGMTTPAQVQVLVKRLVELEDRMCVLSSAATAAALSGGHTHANVIGNMRADQSKLEARLLRNMRDTIQPELDALNRAVRRYEKKATVLASMTEYRLDTIDGRLNDVISLSAAVAKNSLTKRRVLRGLWAAAVDSIFWAVTLPLYAFLGMCLLPAKTLARMFGMKLREPQLQGKGAKGYLDVASGTKRNSSGRGLATKPSDRPSTRLYRR